MVTEYTIISAIALVIAVFVVRRDWLMLPFIVGCCFIPSTQRIVIVELDFSVLRILLIAGFVRLWLYNQFHNIRWNRFDKVVLIWAVLGSIAYVLQDLTVQSVINRCGLLFDVFGFYFLFRMAIRTWFDVCFIVKVLAVCSLVLLPFVCYEWQTGTNPFASVGQDITIMRDTGAYRCQSSFSHSILMGLFWGTLMPLFAGMAFTFKKKLLYILAAVSSGLIVMATNSSTPIVTMFGMLMLLLCFRWRRLGNYVVYGSCAMLVVLHLVMNAPVWHLISRMKVVGGSTGYHRYHLVDQSISHFGEWAVIGTRDTGHWGFGMQDVANYYLRQGIDGGFLTMVLFIALLSMSVKTMWRCSLDAAHPKIKIISWCLCVAIMGHCVGFFGVSYYGQISMLLYLMFAFVGFVREITAFQAVRPRVQPSVAKKKMAIA